MDIIALQARIQFEAASYEAFWASRPYTQITGKANTTPKYDHLKWFWQ